MTRDPRAPSGTAAVAMAEAAAHRARARLVRLREGGETISDEADFIAREVQQAFIDLARSRAVTVPA